MPTRDSLNAITIRGRLLSNYDFASSAASDSVMARKPAAELVRGWVARMRGDRWDVAFGRLNATSDTFFVAFEAHQRKENPDQFDVVTNTPARPDTGYYARASHAIAVAQADFGPQQRPYNPAILERPSGQFWVYLMPAQLRSNVFPLGADVRYLVDRDGKTVLAKRRLHQSLIESIPRRDDKAQLVAGTHTAVLDDIPEDTDVFHVLVRQPQVPEFVVTDAFVYHIGLDGVIRVVGRSSELLGDKGKTSP
ncbi:MAG: hypothetical protein ABJE47_17830 [bacterium]